LGVKKVELSEARAMLIEILAAKLASHESIGTVLKLGYANIDSKQLQGFGELENPLRAIAEASQLAQDGVIAVDTAFLQKLL
jgi:hypothetical protein